MNGIEHVRSVRCAVVIAIPEKTVGRLAVAPVDVVALWPLDRRDAAQEQAIVRGGPLRVFKPDGRAGI